MSDKITVLRGGIMAKIHKLEFYVVDPNDFYDTAEDILHSIDIRLYTGFIPHCYKLKSSKEFEWYDEIDLNYISCDEIDCERYFEE